MFFEAGLENSLFPKVEPQKCVGKGGEEASEELWIFIFQCRKSLARSKAIDKKGFIRVKCCEAYKQAGKRMLP